MANFNNGSSEDRKTIEEKIREQSDPAYQLRDRQRFLGMCNNVKQGVGATLTERGNRYGPFDSQARIAQNIKECMADSPNWLKLSADKKEALEMIANKIGRILNGDPDYADSWHDIGGYAKLIEDALS